MSTTYTFNEATVEYKRYSTNAHVPKRAYQGSAGYDLWAAEIISLREDSWWFWFSKHSRN